MSKVDSSVPLKIMLMRISKNRFYSQRYRDEIVLRLYFLTTGENLGCFGGSKKKKEGSTSSNSTSPLGKSEPETQPLGETGTTQLGYSVPKGTEMLWSPEVSQ